MSEVVVACSMLENEINHILQAENLHYEIHWVERGLHAPVLENRPPGTGERQDVTASHVGP